MAKLRLKSGREIEIEAIEEGNEVKIVVMGENRCPLNYLLKFKSSGYIRRNMFVSNQYGFKLNDAGKIRMVK